MLEWQWIMLKNGTTSWRDRIHGYTIDHQTKDLKCHHWSLDRGPMVVPSSHTPSHHLLAKLTLSSEEKGIQTRSLILPKWKKKKRENENKKEKEQVKRGKKNFASLFSTFSLNFLSLSSLSTFSPPSLYFLSIIFPSIRDLGSYKMGFLFSDLEQS